MKTLTIFLMMCSAVGAQEFGLGFDQPIQPVVIPQTQYAQTYGLGQVQVRSRAVVRPIRKLFGLPVQNETVVKAYSAPAPVQVSPPIPNVTLPPPAPVRYETFHPTLTASPYVEVVQKPPVVRRQGWRWVQQQQCTGRGCRLVWVRVWQ